MEWGEIGKIVNSKVWAGRKDPGDADSAADACREERQWTLGPRYWVPEGWLR